MSSSSGQQGEASKHAPKTDTDQSPDGIPALKEVSWFRQLYWAVWKNNLLLSRRPIMLVVMLLSSVFSTVISWTGK
jgi:hypothetical protein